MASVVYLESLWGWGVLGAGRLVFVEGCVVLWVTPSLFTQGHKQVTEVSKWTHVAQISTSCSLQTTVV